MDFSKGLTRESALVSQTKRDSNSVLDYLPLETLNPNSIQGRTKAASVIDFSKVRSRDDMLYR